MLFFVLVVFWSWVSIVGVDEVLRVMFDNLYIGNV